MDKDIDFYYDKYLDSVLKYRMNKDDKNLLREVDESFTHMYDLIKMFLIMKKERYYGYFLMNMQMETDYEMKYPACVTIDTNPFIMCINPIWISKYSIKEIIFIVCHEIEHIVLNHPAEGMRINKERDPNNARLLNYAMDASVNDRLIMEVDKYDLEIMRDPGNQVTSETLSNWCPKTFQPLREFTYYYYNFPMEHVGKLPEPGGDLHKWTKGDSADEAEAAIKLFVDTVVKGISDEEMASLPAHQREQIERLLAPPKIQWQHILRKYVGALPDGFRKTKSRLNRRQPERYDISGRVRSRTVQLVVAIDTSASMTSEMIEKIFVEIFAILKRVKYEVTIIECDAEVQSVYKAKALTDVNLEVNGRGGTSFVPVIEYINSNKKYRDSVLIYFTDGYGDDSIPKPRTYRNLWVIVDGQWLSVREPFGEVVKM